MPNIETDEVLVNRNSTTYKTTVGAMADLQDNDLMLVNRAGTTYTVTGKEIKDSVQTEEAPVITSAVLTQNQVNGDRYTSNEFTTTITYEEDPFPPPQIKMEAEIKGVLGIEASTDTIQTVEADGKTLRMTSAFNLDNGVFEVGDQVQQAGETKFTSSPISVVGADVDNITTFYSTRTTETFNFADYTGAATVAMLRIYNGEQGGEGSSQSNGSGGPGGRGGQQGQMYGRTSTVADTPNWTTNDINGWDSLITPDPPAYNGSNPGANGTSGNLPNQTWQDYFSGYLTFNSGNGGTGTLHNSGSPGAGYGGSGGNGGVQFSRAGTPFSIVTEGDTFGDDTYLFDSSVGGLRGQEPKTDDARGGPGGNGGRGYGAGGGGGGGETTMAGNNSGRGSGGAGGPGVALAAVTGQRFFATAYKFQNPGDIANISAGQTFVASSGATGTVVSVDALNLSVLLNIESGTVTLSNTIEFTTPAGKGTIDSIDTTVTPATVVIDPITSGAFAEGQFLVFQTPQPILVTPRTDDITQINGDVLTFSGDKDLLNFSNGDPITMVNADGSAAEALIQTSAIAKGEAINGIVYGNYLTSNAGEMQNTHNAFNGSPSRYNPSQSQSRAPQAITTFTPPTPIPYNTLEFGMNGTSSSRNSRGEYSVNGASFQVGPEGNDKLDMENQLVNGPGVLNNLRILEQHAGDPGGSQSLARFYYVKIDGEYLLDADFEGAGAKLTFEDDTNLEYFKAGDQVVSGLSSNLSTQIYTGTGQAKSITNVGFSPDLVWIKRRDGANAHVLFDTARGVQKQLECNNSNIEVTISDSVTSFDADGFTMGAFSQGSENGNVFSAWCFDAGTDDYATSNFGGVTMPTYYKASTKKGFSVCTYTGGGGNNSYGHGLGAAPDFVIVKRRDGGSTDWATYHSAVSGMKTGALSINTNGAFEPGTETQWNANIDFDDTAVYLSNGGESTNVGGASYVAWNWVETPGVSKFGQYSGQFDAQVIDCGFAPALVMVKRHNAAGSNWVMTYPSGQYVLANESNGVADSGSQSIKLTDNGFILPQNADTDVNTNGNSYLYCAWSAQTVYGTVFEDADVVNKTMTVQGSSTWDATNQSQTWSSGADTSWSNTNPASNLFNGSTGSNQEAWGDKAFVNFTNLTANESLEAYYYAGAVAQGSEPASEQWQINGTDIGTVHPNPGGVTTTQWVDLTPYFTFPLDITTLRSANNNSGGMFAIKVDGKTLVDPSNSATNWSTELTSDNAWNYESLASAFDGTTGTGANATGGTNEGTRTLSGFATYFPNGQGPYTVEVASTTNMEISINNGQFTVTGAVPGQFATVGTVDEFSNLNINLSTNGGVYLSGIKVNGEWLLDQGVRDLGPSTVATIKSGTGTVNSIDAQNNAMTIDNNNGQWVTGYYVQTPEKPAISQTGYLIFGSGGDVTGVTLAPQPAVVMVDANPVLTFPATFGTGETPDTELPYPTSLMTKITATNVFSDGTVNTASANTNVLYPTTTTFTALSANASSSYTTAGVAQLAANLATFSGREAAANNDPTDMQGVMSARQTEINDYINGL